MGNAESVTRKRSSCLACNGGLSGPHKQTENGKMRERRDSNSDITSSLERLRHCLELMIDIDYELTDELFTTNLLTKQQIEEIQSQSSPTEKLRKLLDYIIGLSRGQQEQFLKVLEKTQQSHVAAVIRGQRHDSSGDNWPLVASREVRLFDKHRLRLIDLLDPSNGLADEMLSAECINNRQRQAVEALQTDSEKNEKILDILRRKSVAHFYKFIACLQTTKQHLAGSLLTACVASSQIPLNVETQQRLRRNYAVLVGLIDTKNGLLQQLSSADCITWRQKVFVESASCKEDSNRRLLDIATRGSESDFNRLVACFGKSGQLYVSRILSEDAVVAHVEAKLENTKNIDCLEEQLAARCDVISGECAERLPCEVNRRTVELLGEDVEFFVKAAGRNVDLYYFCRSLSGLQNLYEAYCNGQLKTVVEDLLNSLLEIHQTARTKVSTLSWGSVNITICLQHLTSMAGLSELPIIYQLAQQTPCCSRECESFTAELHSLPSEMTEIILLKAAGQLYVAINTVTSRAEVYTITTLCCVSSIWRQIFTTRRYNKRLLQKHFRRICYPFKRSPTKLNEHIEGDGVVRGVAESDGKLYVVRHWSNMIHVIASRSPFTHLEDILVPGLKSPTDIVISNASRLYVADAGGRGTIWRVNLLRNKQVSKFAAIEKRPFSLSVNFRRLLVTPNDGDSLFLFGADSCRLLNHIELPSCMWATHAVETARSTFIVSHGFRPCATQIQYSRLSELDANGQIVRAFIGENGLVGAIHFQVPIYLALHGGEHVIVADHFNKRIVLLQSDLQMRRILIPLLDERPYRLCLSADDRLGVTHLFVVYADSKMVNVFEIK